MRTTSPELLVLARELIDAEPPGDGAAAGTMERAVRACDRLRGPLTKLAGRAGYSSLLSRALALAKRRAISLSPLRVEPDGSLTGLERGADDPAARTSADEGGAALLAEMLSLLITFIGEPLTLGLVRGAWPDAAVQPTYCNGEESP